MAIDDPPPARTTSMSSRSDPSKYRLIAPAPAVRFAARAFAFARPRAVREAAPPLMRRWSMVSGLGWPNVIVAPAAPCPAQAAQRQAAQLPPAARRAGVHRQAHRHTPTQLQLPVVAGIERQDAREVLADHDALRRDGHLRRESLDVVLDQPRH